MWKNLKWGILGLALTLVIVLSGVIGHTLAENGNAGGNTSAPGAPPPSQGFSILDEIYQILQEDFVDPQQINPELLRLGAIDGIIQALGDPHTVYIDPQTYALGVDIISGSFQGIGAQVEQDPVSRSIVIVTLFRDSPAEKAGVRSGDVILAVDGETTEGWTVTQAVQRIRGAEGTPVTLRVQHRNGEVEEVTVVRETITIPTVFTRDLTDAAGAPVPEIAYVELQQFTDQTVQDLSQELRNIGEQGFRALILDLRRNPGGALSATVDVADMFLDGGLVLTEVDRFGNETTLSANSGGEATGIPMAVLIGPGSASGAEVVAGALRDNGRATLIGETTFGKGSVNRLRPLSDGGALYVTIARWLTPKGEQIEGVGLAPDQVVPLTEEDAIDAERDDQLFAAIDFLRQSIIQATP